MIANKDKYTLVIRKTIIPLKTCTMEGAVKVAKKTVGDRGVILVCKNDVPVVMVQRGHCRAGRLSFEVDDAGHWGIHTLADWFSQY